MSSNFPRKTWGGKWLEDRLCWWGCNLLGVVWGGKSRVCFVFECVSLLRSQIYYYRNENLKFCFWSWFRAKTTWLLSWQNRMVIFVPRPNAIFAPKPRGHFRGKTKWPCGLGTKMAYHDLIQKTFPFWTFNLQNFLALSIRNFANFFYRSIKNSILRN